jgi:hypothetical protein
MSYDYKIEKKKLFTEENQVTFLKVRDNVFKLLKIAGAFNGTYAFKGVVDSTTSWEMLAMIDRLVELGDIKEVTSKRVVAQDRVFIAGNKKY